MILKKWASLGLTQWHKNTSFFLFSISFLILCVSYWTNILPCSNPKISFMNPNHQLKAHSCVLKTDFPHITLCLSMLNLSDTVLLSSMRPFCVLHSWTLTSSLCIAFYQQKKCYPIHYSILFPDHWWVCWIVLAPGQIPVGPHWWCQFTCKTQ